MQVISSGLLDLQALFDINAARECGIVMQGVTIAYDAHKGELRCGEKTAPLKLDESRLNLRVLADRLSLEIFADNGRIYMPMKHKQGENGEISFFSKGGTREATLADLTVHELASAWR